MMIVGFGNVRYIFIDIIGVRRTYCIIIFIMSMVHSFFIRMCKNSF